MIKKYVKEAETIYNKIAEIYHGVRTKKETKGWIYNEYVEMPATLSLLGKVKGKKILEVGCGTGLYVRKLIKKGAKLYGIDISKAMLEIAKKEVENAEFKLASVEKIPYKRNSFDIVIAPLILDYLPNWNKAFKEIKRVLKPNGIFIFSIENPVFAVRQKIKIKGKKYYIFGDYFKEGKLYHVWGARHPLLKIKVPSHHFTYETIINVLLKHNFEITGYLDAKPLQQAKKIWPKHYEKLIKMSPFCVFKCKKKL